jgi:GMP reductase
MTGVGYPQLSAIIECADAAHGLGAQIMLRRRLHLARRLRQGVRRRRRLCHARRHVRRPRRVRRRARRARRREEDQALLRHESRDRDEKYARRRRRVPRLRGQDGRGAVPRPVADTIPQILGGVRSACTYVGAATLKELSKRTTFVRCSQTVNQVFGQSTGM